jgi:hypothetical protein
MSAYHSDALADAMIAVRVESGQLRAENARLREALAAADCSACGARLDEPWDCDSVFHSFSAMEMGQKHQSDG